MMHATDTEGKLKAHYALLVQHNREAKARRPGLNPNGINTGNPLESTVCPVSAEELKRLYESGYSAPDLAKQFGRSDTLVRIWLEKIGVKRRTAAEEIEMQRTTGFQGKYQRAFEQRKQSQAETRKITHGLNPGGINTGNPLEASSCPLTAAG